MRNRKKSYGGKSSCELMTFQNQWTIWLEHPEENKEANGKSMKQQVKRRRPREKEKCKLLCPLHKTCAEWKLKLFLFVAKTGKMFTSPRSCCTSSFLDRTRAPSANNRHQREEIYTRSIIFKWCCHLALHVKKRLPLDSKQACLSDKVNLRPVLYSCPMENLSLTKRAWLVMNMSV